MVVFGAVFVAAKVFAVNSDRSTPATRAPVSLTVVLSFMTISSLRGTQLIYTLGLAATPDLKCLHGWPCYTWLRLPADNLCPFYIYPLRRPQFPVGICKTDI